MKVLTIGSFSVPHIGHVAFLRRSEDFGIVTVGVNSDRFVEQCKGRRPIFSQAERMSMIESLGYPVRLNDGPGRELIEAEKPDVLTIGTDWARRDYLAQIGVDQDWLDARSITVAYVPARPAGISATEIVRRVSNNEPASELINVCDCPDCPCWMPAWPGAGEGRCYDCANGSHHRLDPAT